MIPDLPTLNQPGDSAVRDKLISIAKGAVVAALGAAFAYASAAISGTELGTRGPIDAACFAVVVNAIRKLYPGLIDPAK